MYKVGDLVRVKKDLITGKKYGNITLWGGLMSDCRGEFDIIDSCHGTGYVTSNAFIWSTEMLEPATYLTTKEFIKLVENMGYEVEEEQGELSLFRNGDPVFTIRRNENSMIVDGHVVIDKGNNILMVINLYLNTPLELRGGKEQFYTLQCPSTDFYYAYDYDDRKELTWKHPNQYMAEIRNRPFVDKTSRYRFTQKEIENLDNQELVKLLKQEPVEENNL